MPIGLLGGVALAYGGKSLLDWQYDQRADKRQQQSMGLLSQADQLMQQGDTLGAIDAMRNAGLQKPEIDQRVQAAQQMTAQQQYGPYESAIQQRKAEADLRGEATKQLAPFQQAIQYYNDTVQIKGGDITKWTGVDDFIAMRNLLKQSLPNESVMGDDLATLRLASGGLPGWAASLIARLTGTGEQGEEARRDLLISMENTARTRSQRRDEIRDWREQQAMAGQLDPSQVMMPPQTVMPLPGTPEEPPQNPYIPPEDEMYEYRINPMTGKTQRRLK